MSFMLEVYYKLPEDAEKDTRILKEVLADGGHLDFRETKNYICLTYEFERLENAEKVAIRLRQKGEHVEGPVWYGN